MVGPDAVRVERIRVQRRFDQPGAATLRVRTGVLLHRGLRDRCEVAELVDLSTLAAVPASAV